MLKQKPPMQQQVKKLLDAAAADATATDGAATDAAAADGEVLPLLHLQRQ